MSPDRVRPGGQPLRGAPAAGAGRRALRAGAVRWWGQQPGEESFGRCPHRRGWDYAHSLPDQVMPDQVMPLQVMPDQVMPDQVMPLQVMPDQVMPDQVMPDQVMPDQV